MLYIVNCEVIKSYYIGDNNREEVNHIVEAEGYQAAKEKVREYYLKKSDPFDITYFVNINYCNEVIS